MKEYFKEMYDLFKFGLIAIITGFERWVKYINESIIEFITSDNINNKN